MAPANLKVRDFEPELAEIEFNAEASAGERNAPMGYLRAFVTLLVLAHHAVIAYHPYAPKASESWGGASMLWTAFPIIDSQKAEAYGLLIAFNDVFFMSLIFFISGLFAWQSLTSKGAGVFLRDRVLRLGLPFVIAAGVLAPLAYYPSFLASGGDPSVVAYWQAWTQLPFWPAGPAWFLWLLLAFGFVAALMTAIAPRWGEALGRRFAGADMRPGAFVCGLIIVSAIVYIGMLTTLGYDRWLFYGPFTVQGGRILHYALYFFVGIGVGAYGLDRGLLARDGKLARRWWLWQALMGPAFIAVIAIVIAALQAKGEPALLWNVAGGSLFAISCAVSSFAFVGLFIRFFQRRNRVFDSLANNAYGMFLTHYLIAIWLQYAVLNAPLSGLEKGGVVFIGTVGLSWAVTAFLRTFPAIRRII